MNSISKRMPSATRWTVFGYAASQIFRFLGNLILARLLVPEDFGTMALIAILMQGLVMFSDVGLGPSIIRSMRGEDPDFLNTAWTIQVVRGIGLWVIAAMLALPFARFYEEPAFAALVPVASLTVMIAGFNSTTVFTHNRALNLARLTGMELSGQIAGLIVMVSWAIYEPTVWALVAGGLVDASIRCALSHRLDPSVRNKFKWNKSAAHEIIHFGKWIFLSTALTFSANQIDRMVLGKLVPLDLLGIYSIGFMWARAPLLLSNLWNSRVFLPVVSSLLRDSEDRRDVILAYRRQYLIYVLPPTAALVVLAPTLIDVLYPATYGQAGLIISILLFGVWIRSVENTNRSINIASGKPQYVAFGNLTAVIFFVIPVIPLYNMAGISGVALASACSQVGILIVTAYGAWKLKLSHLGLDALLMVIFVLFVGLFYFTDQITVRLWDNKIFSMLVISAMLLITVAISYKAMKKQSTIMKN